MAKRKKIKTTIRNHTRIINLLLELDDYIFVDIIPCLYTEKGIREEFSHLFKTEAINETNFLEFMSVLATVIGEEEKNYKEVLDRLIKRNESYLKKKGYLDMHFDQLEKEMSDGRVPSLHDSGVSPAMMLLYYHSKNVFEGEHIDRLKAMHAEQSEIIEGLNIDVKVKMNNKLRGSLSEAEFSSYVSEAEKKVLDEKKLNDIEKNFQCHYQNGVFNGVKRGVLLFFHEKFSDMLENNEHAMRIVRTVLRNLANITLFARKQQNLIKDRLLVKEENAKLNRRVRTLQRELKLHLKPEPEPATHTEPEKEIERLKRKNNHLALRIETLEEYISELEKEKDINREISENISIKVEKEVIREKPDVDDYYTIVVSGGHWNSRTREEVIKSFPENEIIFIPAEKSIRSIDTIENADLVVFDTSFHAHKYYSLIKKKSVNLCHISKSSLAAVRELFSWDNDE